MAKFQVEYVEVSKRMAIVEANSEQEAQEIVENFNFDESNAVETDFDASIGSIEEINPEDVLEDE